MQEQERKQVNNHRLHQLGEYIDNGEKVRATLETRGWIEIIEPILNKMIFDVVGGLQGGRWHNGSLEDKRLGEERLKCLCAYKRGLTDFHKYIYQYIDSLPGYTAEYNAIVAEEENPEYTEGTTGYE